MLSTSPMRFAFRGCCSGFDWGGQRQLLLRHSTRTECAPRSSFGGYTIQNTIAPSQPGPREAEHRAWYQWYFNTERGRAGLQMNRRALCRYLWRRGHRAGTSARKHTTVPAASFDNPICRCGDSLLAIGSGMRPANHGFKVDGGKAAERPKIQAPSTKSGCRTTRRYGCMFLAEVPAR